MTARIGWVVLAGGVLLSGCLMTRPCLYIDKPGMVRSERPSFGPGEVPTLYYTLGWWQDTGVSVNVLSLPDRVRAAHVTINMRNPGPVPGSEDPGNLSISSSTTTGRITLPQLGVGDYVAELMVGDKAVNSVEFSKRR